MKSSNAKIFTLQPLPAPRTIPPTQLVNCHHNQVNCPLAAIGHQQYLPTSSVSAQFQFPGIANDQVAFEHQNRFAFEDDEPVFDLPARRRHCQDCLVAMFFIAFLAGVAYVVADIATNNLARPEILLNGYDNFGNVCGENNEVIPSVPLSGMNMTTKRFLMITLQSNISLRTTCVTSCPRSEFFISAFHRCLPKNSPMQLPLLLVDAINVSRTLVEELVADTSLCWKEITYSASISFVVSLIALILLRYVAALVIWSTLTGVTLVAALGVTYVWIRWNVQKSRLAAMPIALASRPEQETLTEQWLIGAIIATSCWALFVILLITLRRRIALAASLFREAGKAIGCMPFLLLQPFWTFALLLATCGAWLVALVLVSSVRQAVVDVASGHVTYQLTHVFYKHFKWALLFAVVWAVHFLLACQHFVVASAVSRWFFARLKHDLGSPVIRAIWTLVRYHLGSLALGSLLVSSVKMMRMMFRKLEAILSRHQSGCTLFSRCCQCCLWAFEKFLIYVNHNAYVEMAIYGDSFCRSARRAFRALSCNALRVAAVNSVGDFLLLVAKLSVVLITLFVSSKLVEEKEARLAHYWSPLVVSGVSAYFVAHCFLSVYEMAIDTLLVCFCEDTRLNDGSTRRPFFMSRNLMRFVEDQDGEDLKP